MSKKSREVKNRSRKVLERSRTVLKIHKGPYILSSFVIWSLTKLNKKSGLKRLTKNDTYHFYSGALFTHKVPTKIHSVGFFLCPFSVKLLLVQVFSYLPEKFPVQRNRKKYRNATSPLKYLRPLSRFGVEFHPSQVSPTQQLCSSGY